MDVDQAVAQLEAELAAARAEVERLTKIKQDNERRLASHQTRILKQRDQLNLQQRAALPPWDRLRACCVMLVPSATVRGATSIQICGEVDTCKVVEGMLRGSQSTYMGGHE